MHHDTYAVAVPFYDLWHLDGHVPAVREQLAPGEAVTSRFVYRVRQGEVLISEDEAPDGMQVWRLPKNWPLGGARVRTSRRPGPVNRRSVSLDRAQPRAVGGPSRAGRELLVV
ncbi:hypothetical protein ACFOY2_00840 [Nonomuraea purpurea]|uniref:Uncharacterized protein n=1 Tax=Nonomuraea purpurea TaxID=1849276 RepID=A0ABV8FVV2_9ACTN